MTTIARLQAENYKKIKAVEIVPGEGAHLVPILGRNGQGKSSVLDAIMAALGGKSYMPSQPVRKGEAEGAIRLELSNGLVVRRIFAADGTGSIVVENAEGARFPSPQAVLDKLYSSVAFDPIAFTRLDPKQQLDQLRRLVKLDVDIDALAAANKADYEARTEINREVRLREAQLPTGLTRPDDDVLIDEEPIEARIAQAAEHNGAIERRRAQREAFVAELDRLKHALDEMQKEIASLQTEAAARMAAIDEKEAQVAAAEPLPEPINIAAAQDVLREARASNAGVLRYAEFVALKASIDERKRQADELTAAIEQRDKNRLDAFERASMPVPGLAFGDGEVLFNALPLDQASTAEQLRISTAIGMATAPELRVMLVRDASLLDDEGFALLAKMAVDGEFQFWVESVDASGKVGIVMEDGFVQGAASPDPIDKGKRRQKKKDDETKSAGAGEAEGPAGPAGGQGEGKAVVAEPSPDLEDVDEEVDAMLDTAEIVDPEPLDPDRQREDRDERSRLDQEDYIHAPDEPEWEDERPAPKPERKTLSMFD